MDLADTVTEMKTNEFALDIGGDGMVSAKQCGQEICALMCDLVGGGPSV